MGDKKIPVVYFQLPYLIEKKHPLYVDDCFQEEVELAPFMKNERPWFEGDWTNDYPFKHIRGASIATACDFRVYRFARDDVDDEEMTKAAWKFVGELIKRAKQKRVARDKVKEMKERRKNNFILW